MQRYLIQLAYDGTHFHGWQIQPNATTVQEVLNKALSLLTGKEINLVGCGRTDTGVHARMFYAHFDTAETLDPGLLDQIPNKLNGIVSSDIAVKQCYPVSMDFHARFSAVSRTYKYYLHFGKDPFRNAFSWQQFSKLNLNEMNEAAQALMQFDDFTSFSKLHTQSSDNICKIHHAEWLCVDDQWVFNISANRFLRNMVRAIVGTLVDVGKGKISKHDFNEIIKKKERSLAGMSAPAKGLFLEHISYPPHLLPNFIANPSL